MSRPNRIDRLDIDVERMPEPALLRPSLEAAIAGRALGVGPEATIARVVRDAVLATTKKSLIRDSNGVVRS